MSSIVGELLPLKTPSRGMDPSAPGADLRAALRELATAGNATADRAQTLYQRLRKLDARAAEDLLTGIQSLAAAGDPVGARLLAAFLDVGTAGERLLPLVRDLSSARRLRLRILADPRGLTVFQKEWLRRLDTLSASGRRIAGGLDAAGAPETSSQAGPWPLLCWTLARLLEICLAGEVPAPHQRGFLADLLELEVDAWQERISHLAGRIDPFRVTWVARLLPLLSQADLDIRDLRRLATWVREGRNDRAFFQQNLRGADVLEEKELAALSRLLDKSEKLQPLRDLFRRQRRMPMPMDRLATGAAGLLALNERLCQAQWQTERADLLDVVGFVLGHVHDDVLAVPVDDQTAAVIAMMLHEPDGWEGCAVWPLDTCRLRAGQLIVDLPAGEDDAWPDDLPVTDQEHPRLRAAEPTAPPAAPDEPVEEDAEGDSDRSSAAIKQLVLNNLQTISVLLGFLRNRKITSIPGLVASVATRTRNPQVLATIASDRTLYTGFANRDVPYACLRNPTNVSVKIMRKFIHVKFVNKVELRRMAQDKAGMRKEVVREIEAYLQSLA